MDNFNERQVQARSEGGPGGPWPPSSSKFRKFCQNDLFLENFSPRVYILSTFSKFAPPQLAPATKNFILEFWPPTRGSRYGPEVDLGTEIWTKCWVLLDPQLHSCHWAHSEYVLVYYIDCNVKKLHCITCFCKMLEKPGWVKLSSGVYQNWEYKTTLLYNNDISEP